VAPELFGAPTIGGESAQPVGGGGEIHRSKISLSSRPKYTKTAKNGRFKVLFSLYIAKNTVFCSKVLNKI
jgi:hypothetical protein